MKRSKAKAHTACTIVRTYVQRRGTLNVNTGEEIYTSEQTITGPCGVPLFEDSERTSGICGSCREGWQTEGNVFANEAEQQRAINGGK